MVNDTVANLLSNIRNATQRTRQEVTVPYSKMVAEIIRILKEEDYIEDFSVTKTVVTIKLKYLGRKSAITYLKRVSKPGVRIYTSYQDIPRVINGMGINVFSTSKGIMTGKKARLEKVGGEYLCNIW